MPKTFEQRFLEKVRITPGCWEWTAATNGHGYGKIYRDGAYVAAHRAAYELFVEPIPLGACIDHKCFNRRCVNPDHLRPVAPKQNIENRRGPVRNSFSGVRGVSWSAGRQKWCASVRHNGKSYNAGRFDTLIEAAEAARLKRLELFTHNDKDRAA